MSFQERTEYGYAATVLASFRHRHISVEDLDGLFRAKIADLASGIAAHLGTKVMGNLCYNFPQCGTTYVAILAASHIAIHTYPESAMLVMDISVCEPQSAEILEGMDAKAFTALLKRSRIAPECVQVSVRKVTFGECD